MLTTADQMYTYFLQGIEKGNAGTVNPVEFDVWINKAQLTVVKRAYEGIERDEAHIDALRILTPAPLVLANSGGNAPEQEVFTLPYDPAPLAGQSIGYLHMLSVGLVPAAITNGIISELPCVGPSSYAGATPMRRDGRYANEADPFARPTADYPQWYLVGITLRALCGGNGVFATRARIEYVRYPSAISRANNIDPELPAVVNQFICDEAIKQYLVGVNDPRAPGYSALNPQTV